MFDQGSPERHCHRIPIRRNGRCLSRKTATGETAFEYGQAGQLSGTASNGHALAFIRDSRSLEIHRGYRSNESSQSLNAFSLKQSYDPRDQIEHITRITGLNKQSEEHYRYDAIMNLVQSNGNVHKYEGGTVRTIGNDSYRYDMRAVPLRRKSTGTASVPKPGAIPGTISIDSPKPISRTKQSGNTPMTPLADESEKNAPTDPLPITSGREPP